MTSHILVADDEPSIRLMLEAGLKLNGFRVTTVPTGSRALEVARAGGVDAVLSDIYMPDGGGLDLIKDIHQIDPAIPIILMTAQGSVEAAVSAMSEGATDFIGKPFDVSAVVELLRRHLGARREAESSPTPAGIESAISMSGLVGRSVPMVMVYKLIAQASRSDATVLILGESGTGKELVARAIHNFSARSHRPFLSVNCSGLTDTLLESELFGYVRGAFTGATADRAGLFEAADGGTLFLDELGSTSAAFQASLLRVLQSGEVRRVGATQSRQFNVRVIGASNAPLRGLVDAGTFRADLFYRLSVLSIELPPLRDRNGDIELLTDIFSTKIWRSCGAAAPDARGDDGAQFVFISRQCTGTGERLAPGGGALLQWPGHGGLPSHGNYGWRPQARQPCQRRAAIDRRPAGYGRATAALPATYP